MRHFDLESSFKMLNNESIDNYTNNLLLNLSGYSNGFNAENGLNSNQIPGNFFSNPNAEDLCLYLDKISLGSGHPLNARIEDSFSTQVAIDAYYLHSQQNIQYPAEQCSSNASTVYNTWCNMNIPTRMHLFADGTVQYPIPPLEQVINYPYVSEYNNSQERRKRRKSRVDKDASLSSRNKSCANCTTTVAPTWRRDKSRLSLLCNACGLYEKLHNGHRKTIIENGVIKLVRRQDKKKNPAKRISTKCKLCNEKFPRNINSSDISIKLCNKCSITDI